MITLGDVHKYLNHSKSWIVSNRTYDWADMNLLEEYLSTVDQNNKTRLESEKFKLFD
jgi:hypothetical protein